MKERLLDTQAGSTERWRQWLETRLARRRDDGLWRERLTMSPSPSATLRDFASNDYLGLARDPRLAEAQAAASRHYGTGSRASHLVNGHFEIHDQLESRLAELTGRPRALLFSTGYMANLGVLQALCDTKTHIFQDRYNHASLLDGAALSGARSRRFHHNALEDLALLLARSPEDSLKLVASDGVFSMDGDCANIEGLSTLCQRYGAALMIDDAHGLGVLGAHGDGCVGRAYSTREVPILVGTLGKALGTAGAFVAGDDILIDALIQFSRPYLYTTAQPPGVTAATLAALDILRDEPERRERLHNHITYFRHHGHALGLPLMGSQTPIQPLMLGDVERVRRWSDTLRSHGFMIGAIREPTVPSGMARLRIALSSDHERSDIDALLDILETLIQRERS
ncbi:8-amino-7-oxononanoate synthase [Aidingimonas halophila]|uniref:8-amino-7-ketopelargonate synthase n=1 Tax=Aidingimonas halophila TaxID=574349 RepID=A0A1H3AUM5_9GAMM|nr:8-amino-7-oxononanoate synthase [Aidingimonas halophila]SDX33367.1 8-amino-7-oxononanoate synthase [Aidingimonas halophila]